MKLRAIEMTNLRRFAGRTVRVGGIGDGVSVLAAPNEAGKSTLFDALQAVLFQRHTGKARAVAALQPHQGGAPEAAVEIELDGAVWRIEKRWLQRPAARVLDGAGRLVAQADAAEAWIDAQLGARLGGPAGLLWVRQGQAGLDSAGPLEARRGILSEVAGEIDAMTGGRRMDAVLARVASALEGLATATGRPRAGGPWDAALKEAEALAAEEADLAGRVAALDRALIDRRRLERQRAALDDPAEAEARVARLAQARAAAEAARAHAARVEAAAGALRLAEAEEDAARDRREALRARIDEAEAAAQAQATAVAAQAQAQAAVEAARAEAARLAADLVAAQAAREGARRALAVAQAGAQAAAAGAQAAELADRLARAEAAERAGAEAEAARAALAVTAQRVEAARQAEAALARLAAQAEAQGVLLRFDYDGPARARRDGAPVEGPQRLAGRAVFDLPGLGRLTVEPGGAGARELEAARAARDAALAACGAVSLAEAVAALARAEDLARTARSGREMAAALAPEGLAALRLKLEAAQALAGGAPAGPAPDPAPLAAALDVAERAVAGAEAAERAGAAAAARAEASAAAAGATVAAARARCEAAEAALGPPEGRAVALEGAEAALAAAVAGRAQAAAARAALAQAAPDAESVAAQLARAEGAMRAHDDERRALESRLGELRGQIGALAEQGIEEALAEVRGRLAGARARAEAQGAEVAALVRLRGALEAARGAARSAYFAPVLAELVPLLSLVHPGAGVAMGDAELLPVALERGGVPEGLDILSGGAREQLAVLTRLAFARLWARSGRAVPVILDDALVQTDDERIEAMFTALHRAARDQQVIVLTCRQRAFAALGGQRLELVEGG